MGEGQRGVRWTFLSTGEGSLWRRGPYLAVTRRAWEPNTDVLETEEAIIVKLELAGIKTEDINITSVENRLIIRGERREQMPADRRQLCCHQLEITYGPFEKSFSLPRSVDTEAIKANYQDGFLEVFIPKGQEAEPKQIKVSIS